MKKTVDSGDGSSVSVPSAPGAEEGDPSPPYGHLSREPIHAQRWRLVSGGEGCSKCLRRNP